MAETLVPIKVQMSDFMKLLYVKGEQSGWSERFPLREVADQLKLPLGLVVKISKHLELSGLLEFESGAVDLTVEGIMRVQEAIAAKQPTEVPEQHPLPAKKGGKKASH